MMAQNFIQIVVIGVVALKCSSSKDGGEVPPPAPVQIQKAQVESNTSNASAKNSGPVIEKPVISAQDVPTFGRRERGDHADEDEGTPEEHNNADTNDEVSADRVNSQDSNSHSSDANAASNSASQRTPAVPATAVMPKVLPATAVESTAPPPIVVAPTKASEVDEDMDEIELGDVASLGDCNYVQSTRIKNLPRFEVFTHTAIPGDATRLLTQVWSTFHTELHTEANKFHFYTYNWDLRTAENIAERLKREDFYTVGDYAIKNPADLTGPRIKLIRSAKLYVQKTADPNKPNEGYCFDTDKKPIYVLDDDKNLICAKSISENIKSDTCIYVDPDAVKPPVAISHLWGDETEDADKNQHRALTTDSQFLRNGHIYDLVCPNGYLAFGSVIFSGGPSVSKLTALPSARRVACIREKYQNITDAGVLSEDSAKTYTVKPTPDLVTIPDLTPIAVWQYLSKSTVVKSDLVISRLQPNLYWADASNPLDRKLPYYMGQLFYADTSDDEIFNPAIGSLIHVIHKKYILNFTLPKPKTQIDE